MYLSSTRFSCKPYPDDKSTSKKKVKNTYKVTRNNKSCLDH